MRVLTRSFIVQLCALAAAVACAYFEAPSAAVLCVLVAVLE